MLNKFAAKGQIDVYLIVIVSFTAEHIVCVMFHHLVASICRVLPVLAFSMSVSNLVQHFML